MPATYNGVGTSYVGKSNVSVRPDACRFCGRQVRLEAYDTRLCFVILFIPIIPLGRKRILEYCPVCRRHFAVDADKWETARQLDISGAVERYNANPTPESGLAAHAQMLGYHDFQQASQFRGEMLLRFGDSAQLQAGIAGALAHIGKIPDSVVHYRRALELRPDLPEAKAGVALQQIREDKLDEARALLDHLEQPGAASLYPLGPLETLANAYQARGRHQEALDLYRKLMEALPNAAQHKGFRKRVQASERALHAAVSMLPKRPPFFRRMFSSLEAGSSSFRKFFVFVVRALVVTIVICAVAIVVPLTIVGEYARRHRKLYVVNAYPQPAQVEVKGVGAVQVGSAPAELTVSEGRYHAVVRGPVQEEFDFEVRARSYTSRWTDKRVYVINVGGAALLSSELVHYGRTHLPPEVSFQFGDSFFSVDHIELPFQPLPQSVSIGTGESETTRTRLDLFRGQPGEAMGQMLAHGQQAEALRFGAWRLRSFPPALEFLDPYCTTALQLNQGAQAEDLLRAGLGRRPVEIAWHRWYQNLHVGPQREAELPAEYDAALARDPGNSALLYLRGRIALSVSEGRKFFERSRDADPRNPWPLFALGYDLAGAGSWPAARPLLARAHDIEPRNPGFEGELFIARLALGETAELTRELRARVQKTPQDASAVLRLCDVLAASGDSVAASSALFEYQRSMMHYTDPAAQAFVKSVVLRGDYSLGDYGSMEKAAANDRNQGIRLVLGQALIEQGRIREAMHERLLPPDAGQPVQLLACSMAWSLEGDRAAASAARRLAIAAFAKGDAPSRRAAAFLSQPLAPTLAEIDGANLHYSVKAAVLAALSMIYETDRKTYADAARRVNVERSFPFHLIDNVTKPAASPGANPASLLNRRP